MADYLHRITALSSFETFSRVFIPLTRRQSTVNLRRQLTFYHFTSRAPLPLHSSRYIVDPLHSSRYIVDSRFTVKSLHSPSPFAPERTYFVGSFRSKGRALSSRELRFSEVRNLKVLCLGVKPGSDAIQAAFHLCDCPAWGPFLESPENFSGPISHS